MDKWQNTLLPILLYYYGGRAFTKYNIQSDVFVDLQLLTLLYFGILSFTLKSLPRLLFWIFQDFREIKNTTY